MRSKSQIAENQDADGRYLYEWDLTLDAPTSAPYNYVRHAGTTMALYQFVLEGETAYLEAADAGLAWLLERERGNDDVAAIAPADTANAKLGTAALLAVGLVHRRQATGDTRCGAARSSMAATTAKCRRLPSPTGRA